MPKSPRGVKPAWAVEAGLSDAEYALAAKHGLYLRGRLWWAWIKGKRYPTSTEILADAVEFVAKKRSDLWTAKKMGVKPRAHGEKPASGARTNHPAGKRSRPTQPPAGLCVPRWRKTQFPHNQPAENDTARGQLL